MKRAHLVGLLAVSLAMAAPTAVIAAPIISAPFVTVGVGDTIAIEIAVTDAVDLIGWQFDLAFDPTMVAANLVTEGPFMTGFGTTLFPPTTFSPGVIGGGAIFGVSDSFNDLPPNPSGDGVLARIQFTALAPGISPLTFSNVFLNFEGLGFEVANGQITVTGAPAPVPEPASLVLLGMGFALLGLRRHAKRGRRFLATSTIIAFALLSCSSRDASAQTVAPGPYYATPSWDQTLTCTSPAACPRFIVLANFNSEAVLDRETGLVWERTPLGPIPNFIPPESGLRNWAAAYGHCTRRQVGSRMGWRLPTLPELQSLVDPVNEDGIGRPLPPGHPFFGIEQARYWSATTDDFNFAWQVPFFADSPPTPGVKETLQHVWCVRGGSSER